MAQFNPHQGVGGCPVVLPYTKICAGADRAAADF